MGNLVLGQKGHPGSFGRDGGGNNKHIIGLVVRQPVHPLGSPRHGFPCPLRPLEIGVPLLQSQVGIIELAVVQLNFAFAPLVGQLPAFQPLTNLWILLHPSEGRSLMSVLPLFFLHQPAVDTAPLKIPPCAGCGQLGNVLHGHLFIEGVCFFLHSLRIRLEVELIFPFDQDDFILFHMVLSAQDAGDFLYDRFVMKPSFLPLFISHVLRAFLRVIAFQQTAAIFVLTLGAGMHLNLIEQSHFLPLFFILLVRRPVDFKLDFRSTLAERSHHRFHIPSEHRQRTGFVHQFRRVRYIGQSGRLVL